MKRCAVDERGDGQPNVSAGDRQKKSQGGAKYQKGGVQCMATGRTKRDPRAGKKKLRSNEPPKGGSRHLGKSSGSKGDVDRGARAFLHRT